MEVVQVISSQSFSREVSRIFRGRASRNFSRKALIAAILFGFALRAAIWSNTIGTNDVYLWIEHAKLVSERGLMGAYQTPGPFNHPPIPALFAEWAWEMSRYQVPLFAKLIKLPSLFGDVFIVWLLAQFYSLRLAAIFSLLPASILVSAFHGNTDSLYAAFLLAAVTSRMRRNYFLSGVFFALSLNVKLLPLVLLFPFLIFCYTRKALLLTLGGIVLGLTPFYYPILTVPLDMHRNMLQYSSNPDNWGIQFLFNQLREYGARSIADRLSGCYTFIGRYVLLIGGILIALAARRRIQSDIIQALSLCGAFFFVMTPGFGVQYVVFTLPLFLIHNEERGILWGLSSGIFIGSVYYTFMTDWSLYVSWFDSWFPSYTKFLGIIPWYLCAIWVIDELRELNRTFERKRLQVAAISELR